MYTCVCVCVCVRVCVCVCVWCMYMHGVSVCKHLGGHGLRQHSFPGTGGAKEKDSLPGLAYANVNFRHQQR
jgi:hypothetical protein